MKTSISRFINRLTFIFLSLIASVYSFAQGDGSGVKVDITKTETTTTDWYANPWVWIVGAAVFILLFAAIIRGGSRSDA